MEMKIFKYDWGSEQEWMFAPDRETSDKVYLSITGCVDLDDCEVTELPQSKWESMYVLDPNETEPYDDEVEYNEDDYCNGLKIIETFAEYANRSTDTDMIATTVY